MSPESDEQDESSHDTTDTTIHQVTWDTQQDFFTVEFPESSPTQVGFYTQNIINGAFYKQNFSNLSILFWSLLPNNDSNGNFIHQPKRDTKQYKTVMATSYSTRLTKRI